MAPEIELKYKINPKKFIKITLSFSISLIVVIALLDTVLSHVAIKNGWLNVSILGQAFSVSREDSLGNWFSSLLSLLVAVVAYLTALVDIKKTKAWKLVAFLFLFLATDDAIMLHERLGTFSKNLLKGSGVMSLNVSYDWHLFISPLLALAGISLLLFLKKNFSEKKNFFMVLGGLALWALAVVLDFVDGMRLSAFKSYDTRHFMILLEESIEMLGAVFILVAFLENYLHKKSRVN